MMRCTIFGLLLAAVGAVASTVNELSAIPKEFEKGIGETITWTASQDTDIKSLKIKSNTSAATIDLPLNGCVDTTNTSSCERYTNSGKYELEGGASYESELKVGEQYYILLEWIEKGPGTKTGTSKSSTFSVMEESTNKSKVSRRGIIIAVVLGVAVVILCLILFCLSRIKQKRRNKAFNSRELDDFGKVEQPLMGHDGGDWSAKIPKDLNTHEAELPRYEPYKSSTSGKGAAAEYFNMSAQDRGIRTMGDASSSPPPMIVISSGDERTSQMSAEEYRAVQEDKRRSAALRDEVKLSHGERPGQWTNI